MKYEGWNVGSIIRQLRRDKNMTIDELSEAVGKSVSHITQVEEGTRRISIDLLYALVTELDTDANTILAIQNKQGNISVDEELRKLSPEMRTYFSQQFVQMIKEIPNFSPISSSCSRVPEISRPSSLAVVKKLSR